MTTSPDPAQEPESPEAPTAALPPAAPVSTTAPPATPPAAPPAREPFWRLTRKDAAIIGGLALVGLVVMVLLANTVLQRTMQSAMENAGMTEVEHVVERTDLASQVTLSGTVQPTQRLDLSFTSSGEVTSVGVSVGDAVTPGTRLASIDDTDLRETVADAQAEVNAARTDYNTARRSGTSAEVTALRSGLAVKEQALKDAQAALDQATLVSTIDGVVAAVNVTVGDTKGEAGAGAAAPDTGGAPAADTGGADVVVISRTFQVDATVTGSERSQLAKGMTATVTVSSSPEPLAGTVTGLGVVAETTTNGDRPGAATFPVTITLEGEPGDVFAGTSATVLVDGGGRTGVIAVPIQAVMYTGMSETEASVMVKNGDATEERQVTLGSQQDNMVEVTSGLEEGDVVVYTDFSGMGTFPGDMAGGEATAFPAPQGTP